MTHLFNVLDDVLLSVIARNEHLNLRKVEDRATLRETLLREITQRFVFTKERD